MKKNGLINLSSCLGGLLLLIAPLSQSFAWWACPSNNETLQVRTNVNPNRVRCLHRILSSCPRVAVPGVNTQVGTRRATDRVGNRDRCVVYNTTINIPPSCPPLYRLQIRNGVDRCQRERQPTRNVP